MPASQSMNFFASPGPGQTNGLTTNPVKVSAPNLKALQPGQTYSIAIFGAAAVNKAVGYKIQGDGYAFEQYGGSTDDAGNLVISDVYNGTSPIDLTAVGVLLAVGMSQDPANPDNWIPSPFPGGFRVCTFAPHGTAPAPTADPFDNYISAFVASWSTHQRVADEFLDGVERAYVSQNLQVGPGVVIMGAVPDISDDKASYIAQLLAGTTFQAPPLNFKGPSVTVPNVNWTRAFIAKTGKTMTAPVIELVRAANVQVADPDARKAALISATLEVFGQYTV